MRNWSLNFDLIWLAHNVSDVHVVFHMVTDASVYNGNINSRHPVVMGLRNVLKVASMSSVSTVTGRSKTWKRICQRLVLWRTSFFSRNFWGGNFSSFSADMKWREFCYFRVLFLLKSAPDKEVSSNVYGLHFLYVNEPLR